MTLTERIEAGKPEQRPIRLAPRAKWVERLRERNETRDYTDSIYVSGAFQRPDDDGAA